MMPTDPMDTTEDRSLTIALDRGEDGAWPANPTSPRPGGDRQAKANGTDPSGRKPELSGYPDELERRYYVVAEKGGEVHRIYADSKGEREIFRDYGEELRTKQADQTAIRLMLDTAQHRGWSTLTIAGTEDFRREAWLEASARGVAVQGYRPSELDRQELARREQHFLKNEIRHGGAVDHPSDPSGTRGRANRVNYQAGIEGTLIESGRRPYRDDPKASLCGYVELELATGERHTAWGVGLPDALKAARAEVGDRIGLRQSGTEQVTVPVQRVINGASVTIETHLERRAWQARQLDHQNVPDIDIAIGNPGTQSHIDTRQPHEDSPSNNGPSDLAHEPDEVHERHAWQYLAESRAVAGTAPQLKNAIALESYIERQLRSELGDKPSLLARGMAAAREKIAELIRQGADFPAPQVADQHDRKPPNQDRPDQDLPGQEQRYQHRLHQAGGHRHSHQRPPTGPELNGGADIAELFPQSPSDRKPPQHRERQRNPERTR